MIAWEAQWSGTHWECRGFDGGVKWSTPHDANVRDWLWQKLAPYQRWGDYFELIMGTGEKTLRVKHVADAFPGEFNPIILAENLSAKEIYDTIESYLFMVRTKDSQ